MIALVSNKMSVTKFIEKRKFRRKRGYEDVAMILIPPTKRNKKSVIHV